MAVVRDQSSSANATFTAQLGLMDLVVGVGMLANGLMYVVGVFTGGVVNPFLGPAILALFGIAADRALRRAGQETSVSARLLQACLCVGLWGFVPVAAHWLAYTWVAGAACGLWIAAMVAGLFKAFSALWKVLSSLFAACAVAAVIVLPAPKGSEDKDDESNRWQVEVVVLDQDNRPVEGAAVNIAVVMVWQTGVDLDVDEPLTSDSAGRAGPATFTEDPKLKVVIVEAERAAGPANGSFPMQREVVAGVRRGGKVVVEIRLREDAHPDTAFIKLNATVTPREQWYYLRFELWDGPPDTASTPAADNPRLLQKLNWGDMPHRSIVVPKEHAGKDLHLRHRYNSGPEEETGTTRLGPVPAGKRTYVDLNIPSKPGRD